MDKKTFWTTVKKSWVEPVSRDERQDSTLEIHQSNAELLTRKFESILNETDSE